MHRLDDTELRDGLARLPDWSRDGDVLVRAVRRRNWRDAIALVDAVAEEADRRNHHPDVCITGYRTVTFRLTTHSAGGITTNDVELAAEIDRLAADVPSG